MQGCHIVVAFGRTLLFSIEDDTADSDQCTASYTQASRVVYTQREPNEPYSGDGYQRNRSFESNNVASLHYVADTYYCVCIKVHIERTCHNLCTAKETLLEEPP